MFTNHWLYNFKNGYYSYHYNYSTTQLLDDLTRSEFVAISGFRILWPSLYYNRPAWTDIVFEGIVDSYKMKLRWENKCLILIFAES